VYCPRCQESFSPFQSLCPNCFGELQTASGVRGPGSDLEIPTLDNLELPSLSPGTVPWVDPLEGALRLAAPDFPDLSQSVEEHLSKPARTVGQGVEQVSDRLALAAGAVGASAGRTAQRLQAGQVDRAVWQEAVHGIHQALEEANRDLQSMAASTREAVMAELRREGGAASQRATDLLQARRRRIGQDLGRRLEGIRQRYAKVSAQLDPDTRRSIVGRLDALNRQAGEVLGGLERQLGVQAQAPPAQIPEPPQVNPVQAAEASLEGVKAGCQGTLGVFLSFILPGLGQFVIGQWPVGVALVFLYIVLTSALPDAPLVGWMLKGLAAWQVWSATRH